MTSLFSISYLPPVSWLKKFISSDEIIIDQYEHFIKQSFRNRCHIYGANGLQRLIIPVDHKDIYIMPICDVKTSTETSWHKIHWKAICSAYRNSPYFEFYEEDFLKLFEKQPVFLFDFNLNLIQLILKFFKIKKTIMLTSSYDKYHDSVNDLRNTFHPKKIQETTKPYHQVFSDKHGFINDISCIDLLFNTGNDGFVNL